MKKMIMGVLAVAVMVGGVGGQTYWKRTYGGVSYDGAFAISTIPDGNFISAGFTYSFGIGSSDVYLVKSKPNGDTIWTKTYGGTNYDIAYAITTTSDGNFIVAGCTSSFGSGGYDVYLLKIKPTGDTIWTKTYGGMSTEVACAIIPTSDGNFIVAGCTSSFGAGGEDVYLLKINLNGDTLWTKTYGGKNNEQARAIIASPDGNFIVAGFTSSFGTGNENVDLLKISLNGDTLWTKTYGGTGYNDAFAITTTSDGNFVVAGGTSSIGAGSKDIYLLKIRSNGDTLWTKTYGGTNYDEAYAATPTLDGNFIIIGRTSSFGSGGADVYLLKVKLNGDTLWTKTYGGTDLDEAYAITPTSGENFIVAGETYTLSAGYNDFLIFSLIDDRYAYKNTLFTFKIPVSGDSLNHGYSPLKVPAGMTVSLGGTISWTPTTDSSCMDHVEFLVSDDMGKKDTLTFNIFVNSKDHPSNAINALSRPTKSILNDLTVHQVSSKEVRFSLPTGTKSLGIYNIHGQLLENISITGNQAAWLPKHAAGRYFAKAIWKKRETVKPFMLLK